MQKSMLKTYLNFFLLAMTFVLPMIISWILYSYHDLFHFKTTNHGSLLQPPIQVAELLKMDMKNRQWQILYVPGDCAASAEKIIYTLNQLRKALGKNQKRLNLLLMTPKSCQFKQAYDFHQQALAAQLQNKLPMPMAHKIYLIDPMGNLFMYYAEDTNLMNVLKDLKKVQEVSQIG